MVGLSNFIIGLLLACKIEVKLHQNSFNISQTLGFIPLCNDTVLYNYNVSKHFDCPIILLVPKCRVIDYIFVNNLSVKEGLSYKNNL